MGFLPKPTFLLCFLTLSFSISSILHPFPIHDDTFLPTYPIQLILLPINYDDVYPQAGSSTWCTAPASSSTWCTAPAGRAGGRAGGLGGEGEREERLRKVRSIPWLENSS